jgi:hypothetical protein
MAVEADRGPDQGSSRCGECHDQDTQTQRRERNARDAAIRRAEEAGGRCLLLFRMGDFYELFYDDAIQAARVLGIALTSRNKNDANPIPLLEFPITPSTAI